MINSLEFIEDSELSIHSGFFPAVLPWEQRSSLEKTAADESRDSFRNIAMSEICQHFSADNLQWVIILKSLLHNTKKTYKSLACPWGLGAR